MSVEPGSSPNEDLAAWRGNLVAVLKARCRSLLSHEDVAAWPTYWEAEAMPWRTEPEIDAARQRFLAERRAITPDIEKGIFPFRDETGRIKLNRADVEWLLATHDSGGMRGPVDWRQRASRWRTGLDLRGADLCDEYLRELPLTSLVAGLTEREIASVAPEHQDQARDMAAIQLDGADLTGAHMERATLTAASLRGTTLIQAHLEGARAMSADFERAPLVGAHLEGAALLRARLPYVWAAQVRAEGADLVQADLREAVIDEGHLEGANLEGARLDGARCLHVCMAGTNLSSAHLEGTKLGGAMLGGARMSARDCERIRVWMPTFEEEQPGANLRGAFFSSTTNMSMASLGDSHVGAAAFADAHFDGVNLAVVEWRHVTTLGDEREANAYRARLTKLVTPAIWEYMQQGAVRANRQLAVELRNQGLNEYADGFAYRAQLLQRPLFRQRKQMGAWVLSWILWTLSGYGYRLWRILAAYGIMLVLFTLVYSLMGVHSFSHEPGLQVVWDSFLVSLSAIHGRTTFEQLGAWTPAAWTAAIESVFGIVIEGVFVAMLIQRFFAR